MFIAGQSPAKIDIRLIVLSRLLECVGGGISTAYIVLYAILAETVEAETR